MQITISHPGSAYRASPLFKQAIRLGDCRISGFRSIPIEFPPLSGCDRLIIRAKIMPPRIRTRCVSQLVAKSLGGGTGVRVGRGGRGRRPREGNDERVDDLNGQGNDQGMGANGGVEGVNGNVEGANGGAPDFSTIIAQQLQNLLPAMLAQVSNRGNVGNQNGNVVNENVQENVGNVIVNGCLIFNWFHKDF
ncbi:hypothetical protein Tco_1185013 [Tanacetum coccineum]